MNDYPLIKAVQRTVYQTCGREFSTKEEAKECATIQALDDLAVKSDYFFDSYSDVAEFIYKHREKIDEILNREKNRRDLEPGRCVDMSPTQDLYEEITKYLYTNWYSEDISEFELYHCDNHKELFEYKVQDLRDKLCYSLIESPYDIFGEAVEKLPTKDIRMTAALTVTRRDFYNQLRATLKAAYDRGVQDGSTK